MDPIAHAAAADAISGRQRNTRAKSRSAERSPFLRLMRSMFKIGLIGFGGGSALIPVIEEEVVDEQGLVSKKDYDEQVVSACVTPGALPVEIAAGVGRRTFGIRGMILAASLMALPGALLTVLILAAVSGTTDGALLFIRCLSIGLGAFICSLLAHYAMRTATEAKKDGRSYFAANLVIMAAVFVLTGGRSILESAGLERAAAKMIHLSTLQVLLLAFGVIFFIHAIRRAAGAAHHSHADADGSRTMRRKKLRRVLVSMTAESGAWILFAAVLTIPAILLLADGGSYVLRGIASSLMSFGGGDAYLTVADGLFVNHGMVDADRFYGLLVPIANVLPGSILTKILTGTGYLIGSAEGGALFGAAGAAAGYAVSVAASGLIFGVVYNLFRTFENVTIFRSISRWIRPIISGLLLSVLVTMIRTSLATGKAIGISSPVVLAVTGVCAVLDLYLIQIRKSGSFLPMGISAGIGAVLLAAL